MAEPSGERRRQRELRTRPHEVAAAKPVAGRDRECECARGVVAELRLVDGVASLSGQQPGARIVAARRRQKRPLGESEAADRGALEGVRRLGRFGEAVVADAGPAEQELGDPPKQEGRWPPAARRVERAQRPLGVGPHVLDAVRARGRSDDCDPRLERAVAARALGGGEPLGRGGRTAAEHVHPRAEDADDRVPLESRVVVEEVEPGLGGRRSTRRAQRQHDVAEQPRGPVDVAGGVRVRDRGLRGSARLVPRRRALVELTDELGLSPLQLVAEELAELAVVAVPAAFPVEADEEEVRRGQRLELRRGSGRLEHCVAQRPAQPVEDRRSRHEADVVRIQAGERLEVEVVGQEAVAAALLRGLARPRRRVADRRRSEVDADGPAFGALGQLGDVRLGPLEADAAEEETHLAPAQGEVVGGELEDLAGRTRTRDRDPGQRTSREDQRPPIGEVRGELGDDPRAPP